MIKNIYKVPKKQWKRWSETERLRFNALYSIMVEDQDLFKHPDAPVIPDEQWKTTAWNAAWMANDI